MNAFTQYTGTLLQRQLDIANEVKEQARAQYDRYSDEQVMRQLVGATNSLRYWQSGFDEDDEQANEWVWFFGRQVDELLDVLKVRGIQ